MAAKKGNHKNSSAHGRRRMSRATRIRKRIFGITSLILAIVVANIPIGARAGLPATSITGTGFGIVDRGTWDTKNTEGRVRLDGASEAPDTSPRYVHAFIATTPDPALIHPTNGIFNKIESGCYTGVQQYNLEYRGGTGDSDTEFNEGTWGDFDKVKLWLTVSNLTELFNRRNINYSVGLPIEVLNFRDHYWAESTGTNGTASPNFSLYDRYGAKKLVYVYLDQSTTTVGTSPLGTGWHDATIVGAGFQRGTGGYWNYIEKIPAGFWKADDGTVYRTTKIAVAFREQMRVFSELTGDAEINSKLLMAASFPASGILYDDTANDADIMRFENVANNSSLKDTLINTGRYDITNDAYYEFKMQLVDKSGTNVKRVDTNRYAVSIPLPSEMDVTGTHNDTKYDVYRSLSDATTSMDTAVEIEQFAVLDVGEANKVLQFEVSFKTTDRYPDASGEFYVNDFAVVCHTPNTGGGGGTGTVKVVAKATPGASYGKVKIDYPGGSAESSNTNNETEANVNAGETVTFSQTATSPYVFKRWERSDGTVVTTNPTYTTTINNATTLHAVFGTDGGGGGGGTDQSWVLTMRTNPSGLGNLTPATGSYKEGDVTLTAGDNAGYYFGYWTWDIGGDGIADATVQDKTMTRYLGAHTTATANYYWLRYQEGRGGLSKPISDIDPNLVKLDSGTINDNTTILATPNPIGPVTKSDLNDLVLNSGYYPSNPIKVKTIDYFNLSMNPASGLDKPYKLTFEKFALPAYMDTTAESGSKVDLYFYDDQSNPSSPYLKPVLTTQYTDGTITFSIESTSALNMMGNYVLVQTSDPAFTVNDIRNNPSPTTDASATAEGTLNGNRRLDISDYGTADSIYVYTDNNFTDTETGLKAGEFDDWKIVSSQLYGSKSETDPTEEPKADISRITITIPVDTAVNSDEVKVYQVNETTPGVYDYIQLTEGTDYTAAAKGRKVTEIVIPRAQSSRYNANYLFLFTKTPEFDVFDYRTDKPADSTWNSHVTAQNPYAEDRYVTIESITPENTATITQRVHAVTGYDQYTVIPYEIRYLDNPNPAIGVDKDDYGTVGIRLTVPTRARNKYNLQLVSLNEDVNPAQLILPESATWAADESYVDFTAKHFSEYALIYLEDASIANQVQVTAGTITPADGGGFGGTGTYQKGDTVTLTAYPAAGSDIQYWTTDEGQRINVTGTDTNGNKTGTFTVTKDTVVNAFFTTVPDTYTVQAYPDPASGGSVAVVTPPPATPGSIGGPYDAGTTVVVQASPNAGMKVDYWTDNGQNIAGSSNQTVYTVPNIDKNHTIIVHFIDENASNTSITDNSSGGTPANVNVTPTVTTGPGSGGTVNQSTSGNTVTLTAVPNSGYHFKEWQDANGNVVSTSNPYTFTPVGNINLRAVFEPDNIAAAGTGSGAGTGTTGNITVSQTTTGGKGSNSIDMPRTGMDQAMVYKMLAVVILVMFGVIELLGSVNTKKRRVVTDG